MIQVLFLFRIFNRLTVHAIYVNAESIPSDEKRFSNLLIATG